MQNKNSVWLEELRRERLQSSSRNPGIAALMSFFVMGLGQIYAGHVDRGIVLLGIQLSSLFSAFSLYNKGLLYEILSPVIGTGALVVAAYFLSVLFILVWIYNIKDAYYLSLFSSFRDWFEVERVLLPVLHVKSDNLLEAPESLHGYNESANVLPHASETAGQNIKAEKFQEPEPVDPVVATKPDLDDDDKATEGEKDVSESETIEVEDFDFDEVGFTRQSWKLYAGIILIFALIGLWFNKQRTGPVYDQLDMPAETHLALEAEMFGPASISEVKQQPDEPAYKPFQKGIMLVGKKKYAEACVEFEKDLLTTLPDKKIWTIILNAFYRTDNRLAYEIRLREYLEQFSDDSLAWFNLGKILYDRKEFAQAAQAITKGLKLDPDNVRGNFLLGSIFMDLELFEEAISHLKTAVSFEPLNQEFLLALAKSLHNAGQLSKAAKFYQRVLSLNPEQSEAAKGIKQIEFHSLVPRHIPVPAASENDREDHEKVLVVQGKASQKILTVTADNLSETSDSKVLFERDVSPNEADTKILFNKDENPDEEINSPIEAASPRAVAIGSDIQDDTGLVSDKKEEVADNLADSKTKKSEKNQIEASAGISAIEAGITLDKSEKVESVDKQNKFDEKEISEEKIDDSLMNAVALETVDGSEVSEALRKSAFSEYSKGHWEQALPLYLEYLKKKPDPSAYDVVSVIFEKLSMKDAAFEAAEQAYLMGLRETPNIIRLAKFAEETGRFDKGKEYLKQALAKSPKRIDLRIRLARCFANTGNVNEALEILKAIKNNESYSYAVKARVKTEISKIEKSTKARK